jgi:hypothetical protein
MGREVARMRKGWHAKNKIKARGFAKKAKGSTCEIYLSSQQSSINQDPIAFRVIEVQKPDGQSASS